MIKLKNEAPFKQGGVYFNLVGYSQEELQRVYDMNPDLQWRFEFSEDENEITPEQFNKLIKEVIKTPKK
jgi:hypothetical protein